ncbi:MAG: hypothetical protein ACKVU0_10120 [Saprospiraceae bacterium]
MENIDKETVENHGLWLTDRLLAQMRVSSKIGVPLMVLCIIVGISAASLSLFSIVWTWSERQGDFYLLEGGNLARVLNLLATSAIIYCFAKGIIEGHKAWRLLRSSETDDDALLEGTERLGKMFRWLTLWGAIYMGTLVLQMVSRNAL